MLGRRISRRFASPSRNSKDEAANLEAQTRRAPGRNCTGAIAPIRHLTPGRSGWRRRATTPVRTQMSAPPSSGRLHLAPVQFRLVRGRAPAGRLACSGPTRHGVCERSSPGRPVLTAGGGRPGQPATCAPARSGWGGAPRGGIALPRAMGRIGSDCSLAQRPLGPHPVRLAPRQTSRIGFFFPVSVNDRFTKRKYTILPTAFAF